MAAFFHRPVFRAAIIIGLVGLITPASVQNFKTLYAFPGGANGRFPRGGLAMDAAGDLYGTTHYDGLCSTCGLIYKLINPAAGTTTWTYQVLHSFVLYQEGIAVTAPLTNFQNVLYGTASAGGDPNCGCGTIFKITPPGTYTQLFVFDPYDPVNHVWPNGTTPIGGLLIDTDGTMYGTTSSGGSGQPGPDGSNGAGIIYKIDISGTGFTKLHDFDGSLNAGPQGELIFGQDGAIYGIQFGGGLYKQGVIFRINKNGSGYQVLYDFKGVNQIGGSHDGANPEGRLALGPDGTIYGTTSFGGSPSGYGTAWSIQQNGASWTYTQLHIFGSAGNLPHSGLIRAADGNLYGTGAGGGDFQSGVIYRLAPAGGGQWTYQLLHSFKGRDPNGDTPYGDLLYANGKFYGGNLSGGDLADCPQSPGGCGTVFQFAPSAPSPHDFNGDGKSDIAWRDTSGNTAVWLMNGGQVLQSGGFGAVPTTWSIVGQRDFNGDGKHDLLWRDANTGSVAIWLLSGLQISQTGGLGAVPSNWTVAGTGDFNGDGKGDLLWRDSTTGTVAIWLLNGLQVSQTGGLGAVPSNWTIVGTGDFNGDGKSDLLWRDTSTGTVAIWLLNGLQVSQTGGLGAVPSNWTIVGTGDFNGDGFSDILWRDSSTGTVAIWLLNGLQVLQSGGLGAVPSNWAIAETGDFDGNGTSDILWRDTSTGNTAIWFMNGLQVLSSSGLGVVPTSWTIQAVNAD
jgi:uncharacterized repeat protein (TIGR03803 family)